MNYKENLKEILLNTDGSLMAQWTDDSSPFSGLAASAEEYIENGSEEGRIAALFIYQQLCIEIMKVLIIYCNFYEQICVYPMQIEFKKYLPDESFSQILNELKYKVEFKNKKKLIQQIIKMNKLRNKFGHEMFSKWWEHDISKDLNNLPYDFNEIYQTYLVALRDLRKSINKRKEHPELLELKGSL